MLKNSLIKITKKIKHMSLQQREFRQEEFSALQLFCNQTGHYNIVNIQFIDDPSTGTAGNKYIVFYWGTE